MFHFASVFILSVHQRLCTVSFFFPMGRQSRCSGSKELKSAHDFGRPGKYCTGPARSDNKQAKLAPFGFDSFMYCKSM